MIFILVFGYQFFFVFFLSYRVIMGQHGSTVSSAAVSQRPDGPRGCRFDPYSGNFPEFTVVLLVNDVPVEYYDSDIKKIVSRRHWRVNDSIQETDIRDHVGANFYSAMKTSLNTMMKRSNHTQGVHVYQTFAACDLEEDTLSSFIVIEAYDGAQKYQYDALTHTQNALVPELFWSKITSDVIKQTFSNIYRPLCVRTLRRYLDSSRTGSPLSDPTERPRVRVIQKTEPHSGRTQVSCVATGFYPRRVNMTLLRDDRPVPDRELTGGEVLPNGDGTYQLRRSLSVSEEELRERHRYTCTVSHLSVDNKLDVNWGKTPVRWSLGLFYVTGETESWCPVKCFT
uniref:Ig-like domain-containing protein n=1 Tax=Scleropages formosus TaxID=113540 RepID=A0A8C9TQL0_SCLFO